MNDVRIGALKDRHHLKFISRTAHGENVEREVDVTYTALAGAVIAGCLAAAAMLQQSDFEIEADSLRTTAIVSAKRWGCSRPLGMQ